MFFFFFLFSFNPGNFVFPKVSSSLSSSSNLYLESKHSFSLFSSPPTLDFASDEKPEHVLKLKGELKQISELIDEYIKAPLDIPLETLDPMKLIDAAPLLTKEFILDEILKKKKEKVSTKEAMMKYSRTEEFLKRFVVSEQKSRARLKLKYLISGISCGKFDQAIEMLYQCREIDDSLLLLIKSLIQKTYLKSFGPNAANKYFSSNHAEVAEVESLSDDEFNRLNSENKELLEGGAAIAVEVLSTILRRLEVESETGQRKDIRTLGRLLAARDEAEKRRILKNSLGRIEDIHDFELFVESAVDYYASMEANERTGERKGKEINKGRFQTKIAVGTLEKLKDILDLLSSLKKSLQTGLVNELIYSTSPSDYEQWASRIKNENALENSEKTATHFNEKNENTVLEEYKHFQQLEKLRQLQEYKKRKEQSGKSELEIAQEIGKQAEEREQVEDENNHN